MPPAPTTRPISILVSAMGGEGGGVLTEWIVSAAQRADLPVQGTSIPGVAQRTGATTYYIELWPEPWPMLNGLRPVFGLGPSPGDVDVGRHRSCGGCLAVRRGIPSWTGTSIVDGR